MPKFVIEFEFYWYSKMPNSVLQQVLSIQAINIDNRVQPSELAVISEFIRDIETVIKDRQVRMHNSPMPDSTD